MADLLFAASAADDAQATRLIATSRSQDPPTPSPHDECHAFEAVDDLDVAAAAATAASWPVHHPPLPSPHSTPHIPEDDDDDDLSCTSTSSRMETDTEPISISFEILPPGDAMDDDNAMESVHVHFHIHSENCAPEEMEGMEMEVEGRNFEPDEADTQFKEPSVTPGCSRHFQAEIHLTEADSLKIVGTIQSCVAGQLVVQADALVTPLDIGSVMFTLEGQAVGKVVDVFGCVDRPLYLLDATPVPPSTGTKLYTTERFSSPLNVLSPQTIQDDRDCTSSSDEDESRRRRARTRPPLHFGPFVGFHPRVAQQSMSHPVHDEDSVNESTPFGRRC